MRRRVLRIGRERKQKKRTGPKIQRPQQKNFSLAGLPEGHGYSVVASLYRVARRLNRTGDGCGNGRGRCGSVSGHGGLLKKALPAT